MSAEFQFIIPRHCVPSGPDGMSPLQRRILDEPMPIRIASAPTGAGKSYAFRRAVQDAKSRVLFVVPTRRLAQNLARALMEELVESGSAGNLDDAARRVLLWTSDERRRLIAEDPPLRIGHLRTRQFMGLETAGRGDMIVATPESVGHFLLRPDRPHGLGDIGVVTSLQAFQHIVFDEFHAIDARGFGLAAAIALITSRVHGGARLTFLSATPIGIRGTLEGIGVPKDQIVEISETVVSGPAGSNSAVRALHGDVQVRVAAWPSLADCLAQHADDVCRTIERGRQVVLIYDSRDALLAEKRQLAAICDKLRISAAERLAINSTDDSAVARAADGLFAIGADQDPMQFKLLAATSSVEMGVTFHAGMMLTDPGHDAASLVQRIGRVARGDEDGLVTVRATNRDLDRKPWLRTTVSALHEAAARSPRQVVPVDDFLLIAMRSAACRFQNSPDEIENDDDVPKHFRSMPQRAVWCSALFWHALEATDRISVGQRETLRSFRPRKAAIITGKLLSLSKSGIRPARTWADRFLAEALRMRMVPEQVRVVDDHGPRTLPWRSYARHPALAAAPTWIEQGPYGDILCVRIDGTIEEAIGAGGGTFVEERRAVLFPDSLQPCDIHGSDPVDAWIREARKRSANVRYPPSVISSLETAIELVRLSGIVPEPEQSSPTTSSTGSMIL